MMHGGQPRGGQASKGGLPKMQPMKRELPVDLEQLYTGGKTTLFHERARKCGVCDGKGGTDVTKCSGCKG